MNQDKLETLEQEREGIMNLVRVGQVLGGWQADGAAPDERSRAPSFLWGLRPAGLAGEWASLFPESETGIPQSP